MPLKDKNSLLTLIGAPKEQLLPLKIKVHAEAVGVSAQLVLWKDLQNSKIKRTYRVSLNNNSLIAVEKMDSNAKDALELGLNGL